MTVYLLHITPPFKHARHYIGFTTDDDAKRRTGEHKRGTKKGSPLIRAALAAGCVIKVTKVWPGADRDFERKLKNRKNASKFCPCCNSRRAVAIIYESKEINNGDENQGTVSHALWAGAVISELQDVESDLQDNG